jgi:hypothetical protein
LLQGTGLDRALHRYIKRHRAALGSHFLAIASYAKGRRFSWLEKLYFSAAAVDPKTAETVLAFGARRISALRLLWPTTLARAVWGRLRGTQSNSSPATAQPSHSLEISGKASRSVPEHATSLAK